MSAWELTADRTVHVTDAAGTVQDWLVSPAWAAPCEDLDAVLEAAGDPWGPGGRWVLTNGPDVAALKNRLAALHPVDVEQPLAVPVEGGDVRWSADGRPFAGTWRRVRTGVDGLVDWSAFCFTPEYRYALATTVLEVDQAEWRTIEVHTTGPFVLWLDGDVVLRGDTFSYMEPEVHAVRVRVPSRTTVVHLATWQVAFREVRHVVRLRVVGLPVRVVIPSPGADETAARLAETVLARVASRSWAQGGDTALLHAPPGVALRVRVGEQPWQRVRADATGTAPYRLGGGPGEPGADDDAARSTGAAILSTGESTVEVGVDDPRCPATVRLRVARLPLRSTDVSEGDPEQWRTDVLRHIAGHVDEHGTSRPSPAAGRHGIAGLLARHAIDPTTELTSDDVASALHRVLTRGDCADFELIGLMLAWRWVPASQWDPAVRRTVRDAVLGMKYWITQPGLDAMCYFTENHQLVWHVAEVLVGETFPGEVFTVDGRTGAAHAAEARARAAAWIVRKLRGGFSEFDSNAYLAIDSYALCALVELGQDDAVGAAARTLLDKTLVTLATNSWRGIHGAAHGRSYVQTLRSSRFEETSPILRLVAGVGTLNDAVLPVSALALARRYDVPRVVRELARTQPDEWWGRQVYQGRLAVDRDLLDRPYRSDLRVWRTPDVMLSSVQDYRSGLPGLQEHVWGATLGRELQVFVTHPANSDTGSSARPNGWVGHRVLPRVHQHREALVHVQRFTSTDPIRTTHLWLPVAQADEWVQAGDWIAARRGAGYVAVATPGGVRPVDDGDTAWQEWLPLQGGDAWVTVVGRASVDGDFADWVGRLTRSTLAWHPRGAADPGVRWHRPGGPSLEVTFGGPFLVGGEPDGFVDGRPEVPLHLDNPAVRLPFGAPTATVAWGGAELELPIQAVIDGVVGAHLADGDGAPLTDVLSGAR